MFRVAKSLRLQSNNDGSDKQCAFGVIVIAVILMLPTLMHAWATFEIFEYILQHLGTMSASWSALQFIFSASSDLIAVTLKY